MYFFEFRTDKNIGTEDFVKEFLYAWYYHANELIRPEFYAMGEPIRYSIEERGIDAAVNAWLKNKMPVLLRRRSKPRFGVDMNWRPQKGLDPRRFPWDCRIDLAKGAGDDLANELFKFIVKYFEPSFGSLANVKDLREKHYVEYEFPDNITQCHIGREPGGKTLPGDIAATLPGVYWVTYFGEWAINEIGKEQFLDLPSYKVEEFQNGYIVTAYKDSKMILSEEGRKIENGIIDHLGRDLFFDKSKLSDDEIRKLLE